MLPLCLLLLLVLSSDGVVITHSGKPEVTIAHTGLEISGQNAFMEFFTAKECECRLRCVVQPNTCVGYSYNPDQTCRLANRYSLGVPRSGAVYIYYLPNGLPTDTSKEADGLYYYYYKNQDSNITQARNSCLARPGFRLAQAKTKETADIFRRLNERKSCYVDLTREPDGTFVWGDGTVLQNGVLNADEPKNNDGTRSPVALYWPVWLAEAGFYCFLEWETIGYLCQANYDDQPW